MLPDPSAAPTVASFGGPAPSTAPAGVASGPPRMSPGDFEQAKAAANKAADMAVTPPTGTLDPNKMVEMFGQLTKLQQQRAPAQAQQPQGRVAVQPPRVLEKPMTPEERLIRFQKDGNEYGKRIEAFLRMHIPGVNVGFTFEVGESGAVERLRVGSFLLVEQGDGTEIPHTLAEVSAEMDALGEAIVKVVQGTQEALDSMDAGELQKDDW